MRKLLLLVGAFFMGVMLVTGCGTVSEKDGTGQQAVVFPSGIAIPTPNLGQPTANACVADAVSYFTYAMESESIIQRLKMFGNIEAVWDDETYTWTTTTMSMWWEGNAEWVLQAEPDEDLLLWTMTETILPTGSPTILITGTSNYNMNTYGEFKLQDFDDLRWDTRNSNYYLYHRHGGRWNELAINSDGTGNTEFYNWTQFDYIIDWANNGVHGTATVNSLQQQAVYTW